MARDDIAGAAALIAVTEAWTSVAHLVTDAAMAAGRPHGRCVTVCGGEVLASSLTAEKSGYCRFCRRRAGQ